MRKNHFLMIGSVNFLLIPAMLSAAQTADSSAPSDRQADIVLIREQFLPADKSYNPEEREIAHNLLQRLDREASRMTPEQYELALAEIAATARNGHTKLLSQMWKSRFNSIPLMFLTASDGIYIGEAQEPYRDLIGLRLKSIDGRSMEQIQTAWSRYDGSNPEFRNQFIYSFIESPALLHAAGMADSPNRIRLIATDRNGRDSEREIAAIPVASPSPQGMTPHGPGGSRLMLLSHNIPDERRPFFLRQSEKQFRLIEMPEYSSFYLQFRANIGSSEGKTISEFSSEALERLQAARPRFIILDQRLNSGGDLNQTRDLMKALGDIVGPEGHLYILTSGQTFSAGIASAAYAKQEAAGHVTVLGENVGDSLEFWAEGTGIRLQSIPNRLLFASERHNYMTGCQEDDCHRPIRLNPIRIASLAPDIAVSFTYEDFTAGKDPVLERVFDLIRQRIRS